MLEYSRTDFYSEDVAKKFKRALKKNGYIVDMIELEETSRIVSYQAGATTGRKLYLVEWFKITDGI